MDELEGAGGERVMDMDGSGSEELWNKQRCADAGVSDRPIGKLRAMRVRLVLIRYDVYYVNLHCANHADLGDNLDMTSLPSKHVRRRSNKNSERQN